MEKFLVSGGSPLSGSINISGSKNASLPILAATLLTGEKCVIRRVPDVSDTHYMLQILQNLGAEVERATRPPGSSRISAPSMPSNGR